MHDVADFDRLLSSRLGDENFKDTAFDMVTHVHPTEPNRVGLFANIPDLVKYLEVNGGPSCTPPLSMIPLIRTRYS